MARKRGDNIGSEKRRLAVRRKNKPAFRGLGQKATAETKAEAKKRNEKRLGKRHKKEALRDEVAAAAGKASRKFTGRILRAPALRKVKRARSTASAPTSFVYAPGLERLVATSPTLSEKAKELGDRVIFSVAPRTVSGERIQAYRGRLSERHIGDFRPNMDSTTVAVDRLKELGFTVLREGRFAITASGPARLVSELINAPLTIQARPRRTRVRSTQNFAVSFEAPMPDDLYMTPPESLTISAAKISEMIDDFVFIPPPLYFSAAQTPPVHSWRSISDGEIRQLLQVPPAATGAGIKVGIVDSGAFLHPYYTAKNLDYRPTATQSGPNPEEDFNGHGTAIAYNVFAIAPAATVMGFQRGGAPQDSLEEAADTDVDIISCSWGWDQEQSFPLVEASIRDIVVQGKIVLFASGNGQRAWPGSMPEVISIGGVYADPAGQLEASNYSSGFTSDLYPSRKVPDVSGLVGEKPRAIYIMMPCPPGCVLDRDLAGADFPNHDQTAMDDGWIGASGTSSATPQIAGVIALLLQAARAQGRQLSLEDVRSILQRTAVPVERGNSAQGFPAIGHPNIAVGFGLVNAAAAIAAI
jgi:serine protease AprX